MIQSTNIKPGYGGTSYLKLKTYIETNAAVFGLEVDSSTGYNRLTENVNTDALLVQAKNLVKRKRVQNGAGLSTQFINLAKKAGITLVAIS